MGLSGRLRRARALRRIAPAARVLACSPAAISALVVWRGRLPVDAGWYAELGFRGPAGAAALHYLFIGRRRGWAPQPLLEPAWLAPLTWRVPWREPLAVPAHSSSSTHPVLAVGALDAAQARRLVRPSSALVEVRGGGSVPYGVLRGASLAAVRRRSHQERLRLLPRVSVGWTPGPLAPSRTGSPSVTVVMAVRDRPVQVAAAIASVQAQSHRGWRLVVVDDGSTDSTPDVVAALARDDVRIELVRSEHRGVGAARNIGAARTPGDLLAWLDSDNTWTPHYLATMLGQLGSSSASEAACEAAYAVLEQHAHATVSYRALDAGLDALEVANHVDLNVLVARRAAVEAVGGFDQTLRRAVDYDLVLRLAARRPLRFVPFVGAVYDDRRDAADRVTVRQPLTWSDVVRARRLVDWAALQAALGARDAVRVSIVVVLPRSAPLTAVVTTVRTALEGAHGDVEVVAVDAAGDRARATALGCLAAVEQRLRVLRWPAAMTPGWALAHALAATSGGVLVVVDAGTVLPPGYDDDLQRALSASAVILRPGLLAASATGLVTAFAADRCTVALEPGAGWRGLLAQQIQLAAAASGGVSPAGGGSARP